MSDRDEPVDGNELSAFVEATLKAISSGIKQASAAIKDTVGDDDVNHHDFSIPKGVTFDIAVSARREAAKGGVLKLEVFSVGGSFDGKSSAHSETVTRISFEIPWRVRLTAKGSAAQAESLKSAARRLA